MRGFFFKGLTLFILWLIVFLGGGEWGKYGVKEVVWVIIARNRQLQKRERDEFLILIRLKI